MAYAAALNANFAGQCVGFDTFEGHTVRPLENEVDLHGRQQSKVYDEIIGSGQRWAACSLEQVQSNFLKAEDVLGVKLSREFVKESLI